MIVIDTSAVVSSLAGESDGSRFRKALIEAQDCRMSALNVFEARIVLGMRFGEAMVREFDLLLTAVPIAVQAFDEGQAVLAYDAYRRFGRGSGHPARLNLGDCAAYALATSLGAPLLYKGADFAETDVSACL